MNPVFDHILAMVVISVIFVSAVVIMPQLNLGSITLVEQQQLRNVALNLFNAMLLDTGCPANWGSIVNGTYYFHPGVLKRFGMASNRTTTFYVLDPDKVQRLNIHNPLGYLPYDYLKSVLNLAGYGFNFRLIQPFNVTNVNGTRIDENHPPIRFLDSRTLEYAIKVTRLDGTPVPSATVDGYVFYTYFKRGDNAYYFDYTRSASCLLNYTNALGLCSRQIPLNDSLRLEDYVVNYVAILRVSIADIATLVVIGRDASAYVANVNIVGDTVVLTKAKNPSNRNATITSIYVYTTDGEKISLYNGTNKDHFNTGSGQHILWSKSFTGLKELNPAVLIFVLSVEGEKILLAGPFRNLLNYNVFEYGGKVPVDSGAVKLQRYVIVNGMVYMTELWVWRE
ncbi:MAG: hypothetical protein QXJ07_04310 [Candidatus Bathyarchaeia archaeon]